jgi:hypothetical protein
MIIRCIMLSCHNLNQSAKRNAFLSACSHARKAKPMLLGALTQAPPAMPFNASLALNQSVAMENLLPGCNWAGILAEIVCQPLVDLA